MWVSPENDKEKQLVHLAANTGGYFTAKQAIQAGYSYRLQHYHKERGHWDEIDRGVFRLSNYPNSPYEDLVRWSLWSKNRSDNPQAIISHESALTVHESGDTMPGQVHLTVPPGFRKTPPGGCVLYHDVISSDQIEKRSGFFVTNPIRTLIDVAEGDMSVDYLESAVRDMYTKGLIRLVDLQNTQMSTQAKDKIKIIIENIQKKQIINV